MYPTPTVVALALALVLAGCAGAGGGPAAADRTDAEPAATPTATGSDAAPTPSTADGEALLREAGSFTAEWRYAGVGRDGVETTVGYGVRADLRTGRSHTVIASARDGRDEGTTEQFVADGVTHVRSSTGGATTYGSFPGAADAVGTAVALSGVHAGAVEDGLEYRGSETFDGVAVDRYVLSAADAAALRAVTAAGAGAGAGAGGGASGPGAPGGDVEVVSFEYGVLVDEDGLARQETWSFEGRTADGETVRGEWEYSLTGVGSTAVSDPGWLAEARASPTA